MAWICGKGPKEKRGGVWFFLLLIMDRYVPGISSHVLRSFSGISILENDEPFFPYRSVMFCLSIGLFREFTILSVCVMYVLWGK